MRNNRTTITCAKCVRNVDRIQIEHGVWDIRSYSSGTRITAHCHGETDVMMLPPKDENGNKTVIGASGIAFRAGISNFYEDM